MSQHILRISFCLVLVGLVVVLSACGVASAQSEKPEQTWYVDAARFHAAAHGSLDCNECHGDIPLSDIPGKHPDVKRILDDAKLAFDYKACENCHKQEYAAYITGVHADVQDGKRENKSEYNAPRCSHCHSPHYDPAYRTRREFLVAQAEICGSCHPVERETYLANFHGKAAVNLAETRSAGCTDCHDGHGVQSLTKPEDALVVCQRCHPNATTNMAGFLIHARESIPTPETRRATEFTILFYAKVFFTLLIVGVLGFFYAHTLLWLIRGVHRRMRGD